MTDLTLLSTCLGALPNDRRGEQRVRVVGTKAAALLRGPVVGAERACTQPSGFDPEAAAAPTVRNPALAPAPEVRAGSAVAVFLALMAVQLGAGIMVVIAGITYSLSIGVAIWDGEGWSAITQSALAYSVLPIVVLSGLAVLGITRQLPRPVISRGDATGVAWRSSSMGSIIGASALGAVVSLTFLVLYGTLFSRFMPRGAPLFGQMFRNGPVLTAMTVFLWVVVAPLLEETMFRGVMMAGFSRSFGAPVGVLICTALFVLSHLDALIWFWPQGVALTTLALLATWLRLKTRSIFPAIALHAGYNGVVVLGALMFG